MLIYQLIQFQYGSPVSMGYMEIDWMAGQCIRLTDLDGNTLDLITDFGYSVVDPTPPKPIWAE
jgi:hypothetical protein